MASTNSSLAIEYTYLTTLKVSNFVTIKLDKHEVYLSWRRQMVVFIESQGLFCFIDGPLITPVDGLVDTLVKGWILDSLESNLREQISHLLNPEVHHNVTGSPTARDIWRILDDTVGADFLAYQEAKEARCMEHLPLYKAALVGDWEAAQKFFDKDPDAITAKITSSGRTALVIAVGTGKSNNFVKELVKLMPRKALEHGYDNLGITVLTLAASHGNTSAASILVEKHPDLPFICDNDGNIPLVSAAICGHRETVLYLREVTKFDIEPSPFCSVLGLGYLHCLVFYSGFFDIALDFALQYPHLVVSSITTNLPFVSILGSLVKNPLAFPSGSQLNFMERFIYSCVPNKFENNFSDLNGGDLPHYGHLMQIYDTTTRWFWKFCINYVPHIKRIRDLKLFHHQALQLLLFICNTAKTSLGEQECHSLIGEPIIRAAIQGTPEVVEAIVDALPFALVTRNMEQLNMFQLAVIHRSEKVFNLIYQMSDWRQQLINGIDTSMNNTLHLAGRIAPSHKLNKISGAALQMQREIQWFKEVENNMYPMDKESINLANETPKMVFTREHKNLVIEGEKWMKDTANSCMIVSALITTVAFAAAFTVPGGNKENTGHPIFASETGFIIFIISVTVSLFTSSASLLFFLGILTARYSEEDFLYTLPTRLIVGLAALFVSITTMIIAFVSTIYLLVDRKDASIFIPMIGLACVPITSFVKIQFPLLIDVISSTYGQGIFLKQSNRPCHLH